MAARRGPPGIGSEFDEALVRAGRYLRKGVVSADMRSLQKTGGRDADSFYRDRWSYDKVVRSTHGVNCAGLQARHQPGVPGQARDLGRDPYRPADHLGRLDPGFLAHREEHLPDRRLRQR